MILSKFYKKLTNVYKGIKLIHFLKENQRKIEKDNYTDSSRFEIHGTIKNESN